MVSKGRSPVWTRCESICSSVILPQAAFSSPVSFSTREISSVRQLSSRIVFIVLPSIVMLRRCVASQPLQRRFCICKEFHANSTARSNDLIQLGLLGRFKVIQTISHPEIRDRRSSHAGLDHFAVVPLTLWSYPLDQPSPRMVFVTDLSQPMPVFLGTCRVYVRMFADLDVNMVAA